MQRSDQSCRIGHVFRDHPQRRELKCVLGLVVLQHALHTLMHIRVVADIVAGVNRDDQRAAIDECARQRGVLGEDVVAAADVQPTTAARDHSCQQRLIDVGGQIVAELMPLSW